MTDLSLESYRLQDRVLRLDQWALSPSEDPPSEIPFIVFSLMPHFLICANNMKDKISR